MGLGLYRSEEITYDPVTGVNRNASTFVRYIILYNDSDI